ncbi:Glutamate--tRNA ligase [Trametes pubescens]|uniref:Glutamate--tRNA ligase n=1 Tax=Trametes pubescens TaxID=154538 RepID=A0A1M2VLU0_TRAPU|nr:Glutamate--tRNA ligase [Trametes pubescens]
MATLLRFAPSPTGALHLGGLRTALYNYLYARKTGGKWILRIEDTDRARQYDPCNKLLDSGHAYRCFCSPDKLAATREKLARTGSNSTYDKSCLHLTEEEAARKVRAGEKFIIRLNDGKPPDRPTGYDLVFKNLKDAHQSLPTDPVLLKSDSFPTYHLASVVDDYEMGITHVVRGEEWLPSLPLHLDLYACLNLPMPQFAHLPILLNADGTKMSKRKGDKRGWEPSSVLNWLALAGWGVQDASASASHKQAPDSTTLMSMEEMIQNFDFSVLTHRRSVLDPVKLEYINKHHLMRLMTTSDGLRTLAERTQPYVKEAYPDSPHHDLAYLGKVIFALQGRTTKLSDIPALGPFFFVEPDYTSAEAQKMRQSLPNDNYATVVESLLGRLRDLQTAWETATLSEVLHDENAKTSLKQKEYMTILRHCLTGMKVRTNPVSVRVSAVKLINVCTQTGPSVADILYVLGPEHSLARLQASRP